MKLPNNNCLKADFTVDEWLSNLVIRWEFLPGSTAYLVWSQTRNAYVQDGSFKVGDNLNDLFTGDKPTNVFWRNFPTASD